MSPQPRYQKGDRIGGRYLVHKALMGGMGEVYLCLDLEENLPFALKTFQQRYMTDTQQLRRAFEQEVATWVALEKHPNIVRCFHLDMLDRQPFMVLEWIAGEEGKGTDLRSWLRRGPLDLQLALQIAIDICNGLLHAQAKRPGLVHRDLKPENILMAQGGLAKITDFGLAALTQAAGLILDDGAVTSNGRHSLLGGQGITGTPAYMAPEQWRGEPLDMRTDIYALGILLYELLTGSTPFPVPLPASTPQSAQTWLRTLQHAHEQGQVIPLPDSLPTELDALVERCLAKTPSARYPTPAALLAALTTLYQAHFAQSPPIRPVPAAFTAIDYNNRGLTYTALGQRDAALADYTQAIILDPTDATAYTNRGNTYNALGQRDAALADYTQAITLDPTFAYAYANRGVTYAALGQRDAALADYTQAITLDPTDATAYTNRGNTYAALGQRDAALADYTQAITLDPNDVKAYNNGGLTYTALGQRDAALALAYYNRGLTYTALGQRDAALADYTQAITLDPTSALAYYNRGLTYDALGQRDAALADYTQAIILDPTSALAYANRGNTYAALGQRDAALADFTQAITLDPTFAYAYANRGVTYTALGQRDAALADYTQAIILDPTFAQAYYNRGVTYAALGQQDAALADYTQAITLDPTFAYAYANRGVTYAALGQQDAALADYTQAITFDPNDVKAYYNRGLTYHALGQRDAALADFTQAITLDPNDAKAYVSIGALLSNQGKLHAALPYFERAAHLGDPKGAQYAAQVRQRLGLALAPQTDPAQAALAAFLQVTDLATMQQAAASFPLLLQANFIAAIEAWIEQQAPPAQRPSLTQRLIWLRQLANTHP